MKTKLNPLLTLISSLIVIIIATSLICVMELPTVISAILVIIDAIASAIFIIRAGRL